MRPLPSVRISAGERHGTFTLHQTTSVDKRRRLTRSTPLPAEPGGAAPRRAAKRPAAVGAGAGRLALLKIPAMTDFRAWGTIMGPAGLTAVFGMGTGVAPPVWSPGSRPRGGQAATGACQKQTGVRSRRPPGRKPRRPGQVVRGKQGSVSGACFRHPHGRDLLDCLAVQSGGRHGVWSELRETYPRGPSVRRLSGEAGGRRVGVVKRSAVGTGPLRRSPAVHSQPIDLVVFQEPS
jgi:hypothetical protein